MNYNNDDYNLLPGSLPGEETEVQETKTIETEDNALEPDNNETDRPNQLDYSEDSPDDGYDWELAEAKEQWERSGKDMLWGFVWAVGGTIVTIVSYSSAASSPTGGRYVIAWGAIVFGALQFLKGLAHRMSNAKPEEQDIEESYTEDANSTESSISQVVVPPKKHGMKWLIAAIVVAAIAAIVFVNIKSKPKEDSVDDIVIKSRETEAIDSYQKTEYLIDESLLEPGEVTNGQIIFKQPGKCYMEKRPQDSQLPNGVMGFYLADSKKAEGYDLTIASIASNIAPTEADINEISKDTRPASAKQWKQSLVKDKKIELDDGCSYEREYKYTRPDFEPIKSRIFVIYNSPASMVCVMVSYENKGHSAPVEEIKNSLKFYNKTN